MRPEQNMVVNNMDWNDTFTSHHQYGNSLMTSKLAPPKHQPKRQHYNSIFSDDDEDDPIPLQQQPQQRQWTTDPVPSYTTTGFSFTPSSTVSTHTSYVDPLLNSATYHIHQAENALATLKHVALQDGWKKALKHKSGVVVHMMNGLHKTDKTPIFKGEAVIHGFSPQSIFYVIGMRKLWDEQYDDGNLVENLNDTTSLTYEVTKPTATSKPRDFALVERIECTQNGSIIFVATSVETSKLPRVHGRTRAQIKLQGWILEPIHGHGTPSTKVTFVLQENMKGWVPGFAKKSLARRPLVIALINDYLQKKSERARASSKPTLAPLTYGHSRRPSLLTQRVDPPALTPHHMNSPSPTPSQRSILLGSHSTASNGTKRITFANQDTSIQDTSTGDYSVTASDINAFPQVPSIASLDQQPQDHTGQHHFHTPVTPQQLSTLVTPSPVPIIQQSVPITNSELPSPPPPSQQKQQKLYPTHRHSSKKSRALSKIKQLHTASEDWVLTEEKDAIRYYSCGNYLRADGIIHGGWTPEQICSITHSFGARKFWDNQFEHGDILERFSQKEYLQRWTMKDGGNYLVTSTIDSDMSHGTIYTAATSVEDPHVVPGTLPLKLYGWVFTPVKKDQEKRLIKTSVIWDSTGIFSPSSLSCLIAFLATTGCPPYIRRVAGKVQHEELLMVENGDESEAAKKAPIYSLKYVVKHEPSNSYRARKSNPEKHWCTDIRIHSSMYPLGFDVSVSPVSGTHVDVSAQHIKVFTTSPELEGKSVSVSITTSHTGKVTCNGALVLTLKDTAAQHSTANSLKSEKQPENNQVAAHQKPSSIRSQHVAPEPDPATEHHDSSDSLLEAPSGQPNEVPQGYMLVPKHLHQSNSIIIISDDLTFNGQQLAVMFVAMLLCYYMGKFACAC